MPNSQTVIEFARRLQELSSAAEYQERTGTVSRVSDSESAMDSIRRAAADRVFYNNIMPYVRARFWRYAGSTPVTQDGPTSQSSVGDIPLGLDETCCVTVIFSKIKGMILDTIIADSTTDSVIRDWIRTNRAALINPSHSDHARVMRKSRKHSVRLSNGTTIVGYLTNRTSIEQAAWRNFDPDAPIRAWDNYIVGQKGLVGGVVRAASQPNPEVQRRLAYYYLIATDDTQSPETLPFRRANFIGKLADIRRGHNEGATLRELDDPSCPAGTFGRLADMGQQHPIAQLPSEMSEQLPLAFRSIMQQGLTAAFRGLGSFQDKINLRDALAKLHTGNVQEIIDSSADYSDELLAIRQNFIASLGAEFRIFDAINAIVRPRCGRDLNTNEQTKVRLMLTDPVLTQGENIINSFRNSLTAEEREALDELEAPAVEPTLTSEFDRLIAEERDRKDEGLDTTTDFSEAAMRRRVIQALVADAWGSEEEINVEVIAHEEQTLVTQYNSSLNQRRDAFQRQLRSHALGSERYTQIEESLREERLRTLTISAMTMNANSDLDPDTPEFETAMRAFSKRLTIAQDNCILREYERALQAVPSSTTGEFARRAQAIAEMIRTRTSDMPSPLSSEQQEALRVSLGRQIDAAIQRREERAQPSSTTTTSRRPESILEEVIFSDINALDNNGYTQLHHATLNNDVDRTRDLLRQGADPNIISSNEHYTALQIAARQGNTNIVRLLLQYSANRTLTSEAGLTAAQYANQAEHGEICRLLVHESIIPISSMRFSAREAEGRSFTSTKTKPKAQ